MSETTRKLYVRFGLMVLPSLLVIANRAAADNEDTIYPTGNTGWNCHNSNPTETQFCQTDNASLDWYAQTTITGGGNPGSCNSGTGTSNIKSIMDLVVSPTDLNATRSCNPVYSGMLETDIIYQANSISSSLLGLSYCEDAIDSIRCDQHYVVFNTIFYGGSPATPAKDIICHETGHTVGLTHGPNASPALASNDPALVCMRNPVVAGSTHFGTLNVTNINSTY